MSIDDQLYLMSTINPIIITLKQDYCTTQSTTPINITQHPSSPLIAIPPCENFLWKKNNSAFSKYKARKDRSNRNELPLLEDLHNDVVEMRKKVKLVQREPCTSFAKQQIQDSLQTECPFGYFDPNSAPLCQNTNKDTQKEGSIENYTNITNSKNEQFKYESVKITPSSSSYKAEVKPSVKKEQRISSQYFQTSYPEDDDPFIIVRKDSQTKFNKQYKTKPIKKQEKLDRPSLSRPLQVQKESAMKVGNAKIVQKVVVNGEQQIKSVSSMCFSPPIKVINYKRKEEKQKENSSNQVIEISEEDQVIQIQSSQNNQGQKASQIQIEEGVS